MNKLLKRQISKYLEGVDISSEQFKQFLNAISDTYDANDQDRILMEHSFDLSSAEIAKANEELKKNLESLEAFQQVILSREIKMIELKKEINKLSKELGRDEPYDAVP